MLDEHGGEIDEEPIAAAWALLLNGRVVFSSARYVRTRESDRANKAER